MPGLILWLGGTAVDRFRGKVERLIITPLSGVLSIVALKGVNFCGRRA
ncbi:MAG: hypothetical protein JRJ77_15850 [Deltaproteobacteria bacterium]|nr:hypothetical protein [Deltaproteobacteria bacterium]MBW2341563.1 hypothetical protein [Deltaproteobacteria bacterium]